MESAAFHSEIVKRVASIRRQVDLRPDYSGWELAYQRGNVSEQEWEDTCAKIDACERAIAEEAAAIDALAARCPELFAQFLSRSLAKLLRLRHKLDEEATSDEPFKRRMAKSLLPDLIAEMEARRQHRPPPHDFTWALWVSFDLLRDFSDPLEADEVYLSTNQ